MATYCSILVSGFSGGSDAKESTCNMEDLGSIPGLGRIPGEGYGYPLQYSCLENSMPGDLPNPGIELGLLHWRWILYQQSYQGSPKVKVLVAQLCPTLCTPSTVAHQAPLSMGYSRLEYWSGLPFPSPGDLPNPGIEPGSPALPADSLATELWRKSHALGQMVKWWSTELQCQAGIKSCPHLPGPCTHLLRPSPRGLAHPLQDARLQDHHVWIALTFCWVVVPSSEYSPWVKFMLRDRMTWVSSDSTIYTPVTRS